MCYGHFIQGSGFTEILNVNNFSFFCTSALVEANDIKRARYCIRVSLSLLHLKLKKILSNLNRQGFPIEWLRKRAKVNDMCCCRYLVLLLHLIAWYLLDLSDKVTSVFAMQASAISLNGCFFLTMYITRGACLSIYMTWLLWKMLSQIFKVR